METRTMITQNKRLITILLIAGGLLMVPLVAMQFTPEVMWDETDFIVAGILLFGTGLLFELAARKGGNTAYRAGAGLALFTGLVLIWMNLAVGIIGNEENPANLMYIGVLAVGLIGAGIAGFRPAGTARAMYATAATQMLVGIIALVAGLGFTLVLNGVFALLWIGSGLLFKHSSEQEH